MAKPNDAERKAAEEVMIELQAAAVSGKLIDKVKEMTAAMNDDELDMWTHITQLLGAAIKVEQAQRRHGGLSP